MSTHAVASLLYVRGLVPEDSDLRLIAHTAEQVIACCEKLLQDLSELSDDASEQQIQSCYYEAGKLHFAHDLRYWFKILYQLLLKQMDGPRLGQFTQIMTLDWIQHRIQSQLQDPWRPQP